MGRHTKFLDEPGWVSDDPDAALAGVHAVVPVKRPRLAWLGRTPLMPILAGSCAVGVVAITLSTQQISLNFSGGPGTENCAGCDRSTAKENPVRAGVLPPGPEAAKPAVVVRFQGRPATGGFAGTVALRNDGPKPVKAWTLKFRIPNAFVTAAAGASVRAEQRNGGLVQLVGTGPLAPGARVTVRFDGRGAFSRPAVCKINGLACW